MEKLVKKETKPVAKAAEKTESKRTVKKPEKAEVKKPSKKVAVEVESFDKWFEKNKAKMKDMMPDERLKAAYLAGFKKAKSILSKQ